MLPILFLQAQTKSMAKKNPYTMLCLGDSYTVGEGLNEQDRFPNQAVSLLKKSRIYFGKPEVIATTGWTAGELLEGIKEKQADSLFDFVTLLIGVNNQYRGEKMEPYSKQFKELLSLAIQFTDSIKNHVIVLSIPDWGATPFAEGRDRQQIAKEIDLFNAINKEECKNQGIHYINITPLTRDHANWVTEDGLHPNAEMYRVWAEMLTNVIEQELNQ
ncbi:MAG: SGNH/GDSL hydrolase family protein [Chitinophagales bacterium]|nr:SGNH/GDSL hydrolase family protein [Chitinophagales bacterium]